MDPSNSFFFVFSGLAATRSVLPNGSAYDCVMLIIPREFFFLDVLLFEALGAVGHVHVVKPGLHGPRAVEI
jgi:hypothetical protein